MPLADHLLALPRIRHLIHVSRTALRGLPAPDRAPVAGTTPPTKETTMRVSPSDILLIILSALTLLAAALVIGGLAAHPFSL